MIVACILGTAGAGVRAGEVAGADDPRFRAAAATWLADDDAGSVPVFAELARDGNRAAQVLLALIDMVPAWQGAWLAAQPRDVRIGLLRAPGGRSGQSWMHEAAADTPLAQLWLDRIDTATTVETAMAFAAMGEQRAARETLLAIASRQRRGFAAHADDPGYPPDLRYLIWQEWDADPAMRPRVAVELARLAAGDPQAGRHAFRDEPEALEEWLTVAPEVAPLRDFCAATCPDSEASCLGAVYELAGGQGFTARIGSPSESLISTELWEGSPRARASLLRSSGMRGAHSDRALCEACIAAAAFAAENPNLGGH